MDNTLGSQVRFYRRLRDMTQVELAIAAGYKTKSSINKIERNEADVPLERLEKIANALRVNKEALLGVGTCQENIVQQTPVMQDMQQLVKQQNERIAQLEKEQAELRLDVQLLKTLISNMAGGHNV